MRVLLVFAAGAVAAFGQGVHAGSNGHGFGNVVFPGTGGPPGRHAPLTPGVRSTFADRLGSTVSGYPGYTGRGGWGPARPVVVVPWAFPMYYPQAQPNVVVLPQAQPGPQVIINQNFTPEVARPVVKEYASDDGVRIYEVPPRAAAQPAESSGAEKRPYLLAMKDSSVYVAFTYWLEKDTLHYVTMQGAHNQVTLDRVDREMTLRLNRERGVDIKLP